MQQIGELFLLRMNINLVGSVLDVPVSLALFSLKSVIADLPFAGGILGKIMITT